MQIKSGSRKVHLLMILVVITVTQTPSRAWALPEVDFRSQRNPSVNIILTATPQTLAFIEYQCPGNGNVHVLATGLLTQNQTICLGSTCPNQNLVELSVTLNSMQFGPANRQHFYSNYPSFNGNLQNFIGSEDISIQRVDNCPSGAIRTYRLLATTRSTGPQPRMQDVHLTLTWIAATAASASSGVALEDSEEESE